MGKPNRRYVLKPDPKGWKVYDRTLRRYWGNAFAFQDQAERAAEELNGMHRPQVITEISKTMVR
jgi:hypothetical protein